MAAFSGVFPVPAAKEPEVRAFVAEISGARRADYEAHLARFGVTRETGVRDLVPCSGPRRHRGRSGETIGRALLTSTAEGQVSANSDSSAALAGFSSQIVWSSGMRPRSTARFITRTTIAQ